MNKFLLFSFLIISVGFLAFKTATHNHKIKHRHFRYSKLKTVADKHGKNKFPFPGGYARLKQTPDGDTLVENVFSDSTKKMQKINWGKKYSTKALYISSKTDSVEITDSVLTESLVCQPYPLPGNITPISEAAGTAQTSIFIPPLTTVDPATGKPYAYVVYLNFAGDTVNNPNWSSSTIYAAAPNLSAIRIMEIFQRVKEKYAPFGITITTDKAVFLAAAANKKVKVDITPSSSWYGSAGGVAYVGCFGYTVYDPAWIFSNNLANTPEYIADAIAHEVGHTLGLQHHGQYSSSCTKGADYMNVIGSGQLTYSAIMGAGYGANDQSWYCGATTTTTCTGANQDDLAIITTNGFSYKPHQKLRMLSLPNGSASDSGLIVRNSDADTFKLTLSAGALNYAVKAWAYNTTTMNGAVLKPVGKLIDAAGNIMAIDTSAATFSFSRNIASIPAGTYYLIVSGGGFAAMHPYGATGQWNYGSLGTFYLSVTTSGPTNPCPVPPQPAISGPALLCANQAGTFSVQAFASYSWSTGSTAQSIFVSSAGNYSVTVVDANGCSGSVSKSLTINSLPIIFINPKTTSICKGQQVTLNASGTGIATYQWIGTAILSPLTTSSITAMPSGTATYTVTGTSQNGCTASASYSVVVKDCSTPTCPLAQITKLQQASHGFYLYWNKPVVLGVYVQYSADSTTWTDYLPKSPIRFPSTPVSVTGLLSGKKYWARIREDGCKDWSVPQSVITK